MVVLIKQGIVNHYNSAAWESIIACSSATTILQWPHIEAMKLDPHTSWSVMLLLCHLGSNPNIFFVRHWHVGVWYQINGCLITSMVCVCHKVTINIVVDIFADQYNHNGSVLAGEVIYLQTSTLTCSLFLIDSISLVVLSQSVPHPIDQC